MVNLLDKIDILQEEYDHIRKNQFRNQNTIPKPMDNTTRELCKRIAELQAKFNSVELEHNAEFYAKYNHLLGAWSWVRLMG
jgi:hypothetical protein